MKYFIALFAFVFLVLFVNDDTDAQPKGYLYDESGVPKFDLPELLTFENGKKVDSAEKWLKRRKEIFRLFESQVFGKAPRRPDSIQWKAVSSKTVLKGNVIMEQVEVSLTESGPKVGVLIFRPKSAKQAVPAFLGLNFSGNHTVFPDDEIRVTQSWVRGGDHRASAKNRGASQSRWSVEQITDNGFALVTAYYGDIDPDFDDGFKNGIHGQIRVGKTATPSRDEWGSIAGWAWSLSRILDGLENHSAINAKQVFVFGHSRLGKTALWAGASDQRFAGVISNNSGCGGAALSKRKFGETVKRINTSFPHWFCDNFNQYNDQEEKLPVDQHMLLALAAPRPVYVASASKDLWADPKGEFLSAKHASVVYELLGSKGLAIQSFPKPNTPSIGAVSYHLREGKHDVTSFDWAQYIRFAKMAVSQKAP